MRMQTLEDLYVDQIRELYSANEQVRIAIREMSLAAHDTELSKTLMASMICFSQGNEALSAIAHRHDEAIEGGRCAQMQGLISAARAAVLDQPIGERATQDARLVVFIRQIGLFVVANYETLASLAVRLDLIEDVPQLRRCGDETRAANERIVALAACEPLE